MTSTREPDTDHASLRFPRRARITRGAELQHIAREGKRIRTTYLEVRAVASPLAHPEGQRTRAGLIVPRFRHTAVARNRVKRRLRELVRTRLIPQDIAADIVIRSRPDAYGAPFAALASDFGRLIGQLAQWRAAVPEAPQGAPTTEQAASDDT